MTQQDINEAVATATGKCVTLIDDRGFGIADPLDVQFDPEPRRPLVLDWDSMSPAEWPY
jgi:hypothetical protein